MVAGVSGEPANGRRPRLEDVAKLANVSAKTVSRVVNGERYVAPATSERVRQAIRELGFRPDQAARSLARGQRLRLAGLIVSTLNPYGVEAMRGMERVLRAEGFSLVIASSGEDPEVERKLLLEFRDRGVDAVVLVPSGREHEHLAEAADHMSLVLAHRVIEGLEADSVSPDDFDATRKQVAGLLRAGHRRIAFIGDLDYIYNIAQRHQGYLQAHRDAGIPVDPDLVVFGSRTPESATAITHDLLARTDPPSAIFASNNLNCLGVLLALRTTGGQVRVIGFDDVPEASYLGVPVTLLAYEQAEIGRVAAQLLLERVSGAPRPTRGICVPVTIRDVIA